VWEGHIQGEVPQELVLDGEVDLDGSEDFVQKGRKSSGEPRAWKSCMRGSGRSGWKRA